MAQRRIEELEETLKVTEDILKAQEELQVYEEDSNEEVDTEQIDESWMEDEGTGQLCPPVSSVQESFICKKCDKIFPGAHNFSKHMRSHIKSNNALLRCHYCEFTTSNETIHINHIVCCTHN